MFVLLITIRIMPSVCLALETSVCAEKPGVDLRDLRSAPSIAFPAQFADYSLCPLIFYSLSHPGPVTGADIDPFTIQAMDTVYLRFLQSSDNPAIWGPLDPCSPVTLSQYYEKSSQAEVRFVRCKIRFLLVSTYHSGTHRERIFGE